MDPESGSFGSFESGSFGSGKVDLQVGILDLLMDLLDPPSWNFGAFNGSFGSTKLEFWIF